MNPGAHARFSASPRPVPRPGRRGVAALAGVLWVLNAVSLAWLAVLVALVALWGAAAGEAVGGVVLRFVLLAAGVPAALVALAFAPGIRRLSQATRLLLTGVLACPVTTGLAIASWLRVG